MRNITKRPDYNDGYTLLEVMLFLAISSMLALVAFTGLGPRLRNTRFTDATRTLQSDIVREIGDAQLGVNNRIEGSSCKEGNTYGNITPVFNESVNAGGCVVNGRLVELNTDNATYYSIVSLRSPASGKLYEDCKDDSLITIIDCYKPIVVTSKEIEPRPRAYKNGLSVAPEIRFGYIQSPNSTNKHYFFYTTSPYTDQILRIGATGTVDVDTGKVACATLSMAERRSSLSFNIGTPRPALKSKGCS